MRRNPVTSRSIFRFLRNVLLGRVGQSREAARGRARPRRLRRQVPAGDRAGHGQGAGRHDVLCLQPAGLAQRGGRRARSASGRRRSRSIAGTSNEPGRFPHALTPLSTHDTKRSEDVRARINVLSEIPDAWFAAVERWSRAERGHRVAVEDDQAPDRNEEYFLYQNLLGAWPIEELDDEASTAFRDRIRAFMAKAAPRGQGPQ